MGVVSDISRGHLQLEVGRLQGIASFVFSFGKDIPAAAWQISAEFSSPSKLPTSFGWHCLRCAGLVAGLVDYPLSIGPVARIVVDAYPDLNGFYDTFYAPNIWVYDHAPEPVQDAMERYVDLW